MSTDRRHLRDVLDEFDRHFEEIERGIEDALREGLAQGDGFLSRPFVAGLSMRLGPEGEPMVEYFGDSGHVHDFRAPVYEQILDEKNGLLKLIFELPGVDKGDIEISATESRIEMEAENEERKYKSSFEMKREVDPNSGKGEYKNGLLVISFSLKDKTNKGYRRVTVV